MRVLFFLFYPCFLRFHCFPPIKIIIEEKVADAILFCWGAVVGEIMCQFLGSTNKVEVLKNMEFFRIPWEYQFDHGEMPHSNTGTYLSDVPRACINSRIKKIQQLIWLVDSARRQRTQGLSFVPAGVAIAASTLRGCRIWSRRNRLIGLRRKRSSVCQHYLFIFLTIWVLAAFAGIDVLFLCRLTYDATLTEPTSLKKMSAVKDDEQIHLDVSKPSQVCLSPLSIPP